MSYGAFFKSLENLALPYVRKRCEEMGFRLSVNSGGDSWGATRIRPIFERPNSIARPELVEALDHPAAVTAEELLAKVERAAKATKNPNTWPEDE